MKFVFIPVICFFAGAVQSQTSMLAEFKAMPAFPATAQEAFKSSKTKVADKTCIYVGNSDAITAYTEKLKKDLEPYTAIILAKGKAGTPAGMAAASDFSDLNSPETQAKLAKMTQEEKIKFAMEIQARMAANKNVQTVNTINKPSPLTAITTQVGQAYQQLIPVLQEFKAGVNKTYNICDGICGGEGVNDPTCQARITACENKESHAYFKEETTRYAQFMKDVTANYNKQKVNFEASLKQFDEQASKYSKEEIAGDYSLIIGWIGAISNFTGAYEKSGSEIIVSAKNNTYVKAEY
ncbi:MAG: hypothetical protein ACXVPQ_04235 [Bacteroidia bacterium]